MGHLTPFQQVMLVIASLLWIMSIGIMVIEADSPTEKFEIDSEFLDELVNDSSSNINFDDFMQSDRIKPKTFANELDEILGHLDMPENCTGVELEKYITEATAKGSLLPLVEKIKEHGWQIYSCENDKVNKYGTHVTVWFLPDFNGGQQNKNVFVNQMKYSLHGYWQKDVCYCKSKCQKKHFLKTDQTVTETLKDIVHDNIDLARQISLQSVVWNSMSDDFFKCIKPHYAPTRPKGSIKDSIRHEWKKHYLQNLDDIRYFYLDLLESLALENKLVYPHSCRYDVLKKINVVQQVVQIFKPDQVNKWNYKETCKGDYYKFITDSDKIFEFGDFPLVYINGSYSSDRYRNRMEMNNILEDVHIEEETVEEPIIGIKKATITDLAIIHHEKIKERNIKAEAIYGLFGQLGIKFSKAASYIKDNVLSKGTRHVWEWTRSHILTVLHTLFHFFALAMALFVSTFKKIKKSLGKKNVTLKKMNFLEALWNARVFYVLSLSVLSLFMYLFCVVEWISVVYCSLIGIWMLKSNFTVFRKNNVLLWTLIVALQVVTVWCMFRFFHYNIVVTHKVSGSLKILGWTDIQVEPYSTYDEFVNNTNQYYADQRTNLDSVGRYKDAAFYSKIMARRFTWWPINFTRLNVFNDLAIVPFFVFFYIFFYVIRLFTEYFNRKAIVREIEENLIDKEVLISSRSMESLAFSYLIDFTFMVGSLILVTYLFVTTQLYGKTLTELEIISFDNIFRFVTFVSVVFMTIDGMMVFVPWSRRNMQVLESVLVLMSFVYKYDEFKVVTSVMPQLIEQVYKEMNFTLVVICLIVLFAYVSSFKKHYKYTTLWVVVVEIICLLPTVKIAMKIDTLLNFVDYIKGCGENYGYELTEGIQAIVIALLIIITMNIDFVTRPTTIFKATDTGNLQVKVSYLKHFSYMIQVLFRVFYVVAAIALICQIVQLNIESGIQAITGWQIATTLFSVLILIVVAGTVYMYYNMLKKIEFDADNRFKEIMFAVFLCMILFCVFVAVAGLVLVLTLYSTGFIRQLVFGQYFAPFITMVFFFEICFSFIGTIVDGFRSILTSFLQNTEFGSTIMHIFDQIVQLIRFLFWSFKIINYCRVVLSLNKIFSNYINSTESFAEMLGSLAQMPATIVLIVLLLDLLTGVHKLIWNMVVTCEELYRYEKWERDIDHGDMIRNCQILQQEWAPIQLNLNAGRGINEHEEVIQTKHYTNNPKEQKTISGPSFYNPDPATIGEPDVHVNNPNCYEMAEPEFDDGNLNQGNNFDVQANLNQQMAVIDEADENEEMDDEVIIEEDAQMDNEPIIEDAGNDAEPPRNNNRGNNRRNNREPRQPQRPILSINKVPMTNSTEETRKSVLHFPRNDRFEEGRFVTESSFVKSIQGHKYAYESTINVQSGETVMDKEIFDKKPELKERTIYAPIGSFIKNKVQLRNMTNLVDLLTENNIESIQKGCDALNSRKKVTDEIFGEMSGIHTIYVKTKLNSLKDDLIDPTSWPMLSLAVLNRLTGSLINNVNITTALSALMPRVVLANLNKELEGIFTTDTIEKDEILTMDEYLMCTNTDFRTLVNQVKNKNIYLLTTKTGKTFVTTSAVSCSLLLGRDEKYSLDNRPRFGMLEFEKLNSERKVRPFRIEEDMMYSAGNNSFSAKLTLLKDQIALHCTEFDVYITDKIPLHSLKMENQSLTEFNHKWMLGVMALSVGVVFDGNPISDECGSRRLDINLHHGSCTTIRMPDDADNLFILTNKHVVQDNYTGVTKTFTSPLGGVGKSISIKPNLHALYTICGEPISIPMEDLVAFGNDYAMFKIPLKFKKQMLKYFQRINHQNPLIAFPTFGVVKEQNNSFTSMSRQLDRTLSSVFNKIRQFQTFMMWDEQEKQFDVWGYTVPGMSGSPIFNINYNLIELIGLHSAVEHSKLNMVHTTRIISADRIKRHCLCFDLKKPGNLKQKPRNDDCEFPCATTRVEKIGDKMNSLQMCNGSLNTMELDSIFQSNEWPHHMLSKNYILCCDDESPNEKLSKKIFRDIYDNALNSFENTVLPSNIGPQILIDELCAIAKKHPKMNSNNWNISKSTNKEINYSYIIKLMNGIKDKTAKINGKIMEGIEWTTKDHLYNIQTRYSGQGLWDLEIVDNLDSESCRILVDDSLVLELILVCEVMTERQIDRVISNLKQINRVGKVYVAFYDGNSLVFQEKSKNERKCVFDEKVDIFILTNGKECIEISASEMTALQKFQVETPNEVDKIKFLLKKLEQAQVHKLDLDKKIELTKSKLKDMRADLDYITKSQEYKKALKAYQEEKDKYKEGSKEREELARSLKQTLQQVEKKYLSKLQELKIKKSQLSEIQQKKIQQLKDEKDKIKIKFEKKIQEKKNQMEKVNQQIKELKITMLNEMNKVMVQDKLIKMEENIKKINSEILTMQQEKESEKAKIKLEISELEKEKPKSSIVVENPENKDEIIHKKNELINLRKQSSEVQKQQEEYQQQIKDLQVSIRKKASLIEDTITRESMNNRIEVLCNSTVSYNDLIKGALDIIDEIVKHYTGERQSETRDLARTYEAEIAELKKKNEETQRKIDELINKMTEKNKEDQQKKDKVRQDDFKTETKIELAKMKEDVDMKFAAIMEELAKNRTNKKKIENQRKFNENYDQGEDDREFDEGDIDTPNKNQNKYKVKQTKSAPSDTEAESDYEQRAKKRTNKKKIEGQKKRVEFREKLEERQEKEDQQPVSPPENNNRFRPRPSAIKTYASVTTSNKVDIIPKKTTFEEFVVLIKKDIEKMQKGGFGSNRLDRLIKSAKIAVLHKSHLRAKINYEFIQADLPDTAQELIDFLQDVKELEASDIKLDQVIIFIKKAYNGEDPRAKRDQIQSRHFYLGIAAALRKNKSDRARQLRIILTSKEATDEEIMAIVEDNNSNLVPELQSKQRWSKASDSEYLPGFAKYIIKTIIPKLTTERENSGRNVPWANKDIEKLINESQIILISEQEHLEFFAQIEEPETFLLNTLQELYANRQST